jgi:hypothetical protein
MSVKDFSVNPGTAYPVRAAHWEPKATTVGPSLRMMQRTYEEVG